MGDTQLEVPRRTKGRDTVGLGREGQAGSQAGAGCWVQELSLSGLQTKVVGNFVVSETFGTCGYRQ